MDIIWHGDSCFTIKGKSGTVVIDPYKTGNKLPAFTADIVLLSQGAKEIVKIEGEPRIFDWPGEYEVNEVPIIGTQYGQDATMFKIIVDGVKICHLGKMKEKLATEKLEALGDIDVLIIPVGGGETLDAKKAHDIIEEIEPRAVIPMCYESADAFAKELGAKQQEVEKFTLGGLSTLPEDRMDVIILQPQM